MFRHAVAGLFLSVAACGGADGLPISGDVVIGVGGEAITPTVGATIRDADGNFLVVIGTRDISCQTNLQSPLRKGTYAMIVIAPVPGGGTFMPGLVDAQVTVIRVQSSGTLFNGGTDSVMLDQLGDVVAGSVDFATSDETVDLTVSGTFEVENCSP